MATIVEELVGLVGLEVDEGSFRRAESTLENIGRQFDRIASSAKMLAASGAAVLGFTAITNKMTAEQARMAEAVGISSEALAAYASIAKEGGLNVDNVTDLVEELNNKLGESKGIEEMTAVSEATKILGLEFENLKNLKPEEQFFAVLDAAKQLEDQQAAVSAADILMGGEANKFIGLLRTQDKSLQQIIGDYSELNFLTSEAEESAKKFNKTFSGLTTVIGTATKQLGALLGEAIEPVIAAINDWIVENKELTQTIIAAFANAIPIALGVAALAVGVMTIALIKMAIAWAAVNTALIISSAITLGWIALWVAVAAAIALVVDDIVTFIKYGDEANTLTGKLVKWFKDLGSAIMTGAAPAIEYLTEKINIVLTKFREVFDLIKNIAKNSTIIKWVGGLFGDDEEGGVNSSAISATGSAVPVVSPAAAASAGSAINSTINNANNSNVVNLNAPNLDRFGFNQILDEQNAEAARVNSSGRLR